MVLMMPTLAYSWMNSVDDANPAICQGWHHQHYSSSYMPGLASSTPFIQLYARVGIINTIHPVIPTTPL
jgi:hypothetical protein